MSQSAEALCHPQDGYHTQWLFAPLDHSQFWITQTLTKRLVHRWRMEADAILVGTNTALMDDPQLDNRLYYGKSPLRIVLDRKLQLPNNLKIFSDGQPTLIITEQDKPINSASHLHYLSMNFGETFWPDLLAILWRDYKLGVILVEGGQKVLSSLIDTGLWDEARVLIGQKPLAVGIPSPILPGSPEKTLKLGLDELKVYQHVQRS
ncbi:MAG: RibD family protein [Haliscomenobacter sp.]|nr:RibD family protein [Haliscomenobacter sp.]MBK9490477.1 RibD family protein [Haliscomenobacter sp.]